MRDRVSSRLERNTDDKMLCGVSSGIGDYFGIDTALVRVGFVVATLLSGGIVILIYIVLAIVMPERDSDASDAQLYGEPGEARPRSSSNPATVTGRKQLAGLIMVGIGALALAINLGAFRWLDFSTFWPLAFILVGLLIVFAGMRSGGRR